MKRRTFLYESSLLAFSMGVAGTVKWNGNSYVGTEPTTTDILGPYYRPGAPLTTDLVQPGTKAEILHFSGTILDTDGATPVKDALVEIWHCDETGTYDNTSDAYVYRAACKTRKDGKYHFRTIFPVPYSISAELSRPAHIHMRISGTGQQDLVTQVYFKGDKHIPTDFSASDPRSLNRILDVAKNADNEIMVRFDIVMRKAYVLEAAAMKKLEGIYEMSDKSLVEFYGKEDALFTKMNGQIVESMEYIGNNSFQGGLGGVKAEFTVEHNGGINVVLTYLDDKDKPVLVKGKKTLKYPV